MVGGMSEEQEHKMTPEEEVEHLKADNKALKDEIHMLKLKLESKYEDCVANTLDHIWKSTDYAEYCQAHDLLVRHRVNRDKLKPLDPHD